MPFFKDNLIGYIEKAYGSLPDEWQKVALYRNLNFDTDLPTEHAAALEEMGLPVETNAYEHIDPQMTEHDEAIQARIAFYREGLQLGFTTSIGIIDALLALSASLLGEGVAQAGTNVRPLLLAEVVNSVQMLSEEQGLPPHMTLSLQHLIRNTVEEHINRAFNLTPLEPTPLLTENENEA